MRVSRRDQPTKGNAPFSERGAEFGKQRCVLMTDLNRNIIVWILTEIYPVVPDSVLETLTG